MKAVLSFVVALAVGSAVATAQSVDEQIAERIAPVGETCMQGDECAAAAPAAAATAGGGSRSGQEVYDSSCHTCHAVGVAGAPKFGDAASWQKHIDKGLETLYTNAINGINAMPPKGLCMDCSDEEIKVAVDYMVNNSQ
ncbi:cytochrome c5 family protein [Microbulbifer sp. TYP-18]|uniref:cytochrome c5 family protein n=1 Tax=Microbulbifer sp. TYP-18 TaxID=3230024 RepID=UPI0034C61BAA